MSDSILRELAHNGNGVMAPTPPTNVVDVELPPDRAKAVEYGLVQYQQLAHERDLLVKEITELRDHLAGAQIENDGLHSQLTEAQSRIQSMQITHDDAIAGRIKYEALFVSMSAQMRAFAVPTEPLIKNRDA